MILVSEVLFIFRAFMIRFTAALKIKNHRTKPHRKPQDIFTAQLRTAKSHRTIPHKKIGQSFPPDANNILIYQWLWCMTVKSYK